MTKASSTAVQTSQEPLLTWAVKQLIQHQSHLTLPGAPLKLHYTTSSRTQSRVGFLQGTHYILLPPPKINPRMKKILCHHQSVCTAFSTDALPQLRLFSPCFEYMLVVVKFQPTMLQDLLHLKQNKDIQDNQNSKISTSLQNLHHQMKFSSPT